IALRSASVLDRHAVDAVALEILAGGFRLILVEPGESGAVEGRATLIHRFGKRICTSEHFRRLALHGAEPLLGFLLGLIGAPLDHPAAAHLLFRGCSRGRSHPRRCRRGLGGGGARGSGGGGPAGGGGRGGPRRRRITSPRRR